MQHQIFNPFPKRKLISQSANHTSQVHLTISSKLERSKNQENSMCLSKACTREANSDLLELQRAGNPQMACTAQQVPACQHTWCHCHHQGGFPAGREGSGELEKLNLCKRPCRTPGFFMSENILGTGRGTQALLKQCQARGQQQRRDRDKPTGVQVSLSPTAYETCSQEIVLSKLHYSSHRI